MLIHNSLRRPSEEAEENVKKQIPSSNNQHAEAKVSDFQVHDLEISPSRGRRIMSISPIIRQKPRITFILMSIPLNYLRQVPNCFCIALVRLVMDRCRQNSKSNALMRSRHGDIDMGFLGRVVVPSDCPLGVRWEGVALPCRGVGMGAVTDPHLLGKATA